MLSLIALVALAYRDVRSKDQFGDLLESLGYPALPESASNGKSMLVNK